MPPRKQWEEEEEESSSAPSTPPVVPVRRSKFQDEEGEDSDVLESWDAAEDSEVEREKVKKAAEAKAKAEAEAAASKKSKKQRIEEHRAERARQLATDGDESSGEEETEAQQRERLRATEKESDMRHAEDLFAEVGISADRKGTTAGAAVVVDPKDPHNTVNIASLPLFNPNTKLQFENLRETLAPILVANAKKAHYSLFLQEFTKLLVKDLPSDQIKKISSSLTTLGNEKMKEEKLAEKGGKKSKAQKTKASLVATRPNVKDTNTYEDTFKDDDFM